MTTPLWCLLGFVGWTLVLLVALAGVRVSKVLSGAARPGDFPAGVPHGSDAYWRLNRAHSNCLENLPLFASVVLITAVGGLGGPTLDTLARTYLAARVGQSLAHLSGGGSVAVNVRFTFFLVQLGCLVGVGLVILRSA
jgi:uncharacterized MAPEG superfamily protein